MPDAPHDLSDSSDFEVEIYLGQLVRASLAEHRGCVLLAHEDHLVALPARTILAAVPMPALAGALLVAGWDDATIVSVLEALHPPEETQ